MRTSHRFSPFSPSKSATWLNCPASVRENLLIGDQPPTPAMQEGTVAHETLERIFRKKEVDASQEMVDCAKRALDYCESRFEGFEECLLSREETDLFSPKRKYLFRDGNFSAVEIPLHLGDIVPWGTGTADFIFWNKEEQELNVMDYKFGFQKVRPSESTQLLLYAVSILETMDVYPRRTTLHIVQPRIDYAAAYTPNRAELIDFPARVKAAVRECTSNYAEYKPSEKACQFCASRMACPALVNGAELAVSKMKQLEKENKTEEIFSDPELSVLLANSKLLKGWLNDLEKIAVKHLLTGGNIEGISLEKKAGRTTIPASKYEKLWNDYGEKAFRPIPRLIGELRSLIPNLADYTDQKAMYVLKAEER